MSHIRYLVTKYRGHWRIQYDGRYSTRYRTQEDAVKIAIERARLDRESEVVVQDEDARLHLAWICGQDMRAFQG